MRQNEKDYLDQLFASSSDQNDEVATDIPQVEIPVRLSERLYAIADSAPSSEQQTVSKDNVVSIANFTEKFGRKFAGMAASLFAVVIAFQFYQQYQTLRQLEQVQADLATALHYLGEANRIARSQVLNSLNDNIQNAGVKPALEIGRDAFKGSTAPSSQQDNTETRLQTHSL